MKINNVEYDLNELLQHHDARSAEAARQLRAATGVTLKEARKILTDYEKGIMPNSRQTEPLAQKPCLLLASLMFTLLIIIIIIIIVVVL